MRLNEKIDWASLEEIRFKISRNFNGYRLVKADLM